MIATSIPLMPHRVCWAADPTLVWTMVVTNAITFLSYFSICLALLYLVRRTRRVIARDWAWFCVGFALFIVACGSTHLMEVVTTWVPLFWLDAAANIITAVLSAVVAIMLFRRVAIIGFSINDYSDRLANSEAEKQRLIDSLIAARKLEDWSRMSAAIAHEINNPLETVQNLLYLIRTSTEASHEVVDLAGTASEEAERVMTISRSTLTFFRQTTQPEAIDLHLAVESVRFMLANQMYANHVHLEVVETGKDFTVQAFPGEARQVLLNLVRNAVEATREVDTSVTVTLASWPEGVEITVQDRGIGIPAERLEQLFEFGNSTKGPSGNGIGLWTVKHILKRHGGRIAVDSVVGEGTRFTLFWPRSFSPAASPSGERAVPVA